GEGAQQCQVGQGVARVQDFDAARDVEFVGGVDEVVAPVVVKWLAVAGAAVDTCGAGDFAGFGVFEYEQKAARSAFGGVVGQGGPGVLDFPRSEEHTSELQSRENLVCRLQL